MLIEIPTNKDKIFKQYLHILNPILSSRKLSNTEIDVLATILYIDNMYSTYTREQRDKIIFAKETRIRIREKIKLSTDSYNNVLTSLRKKLWISKRSLLIQAPIINNEININYKLKLQ